MFIIKYKKIFYIITVLFIAGGIFTIFNRGLNWGMDFTGGTLLEAEYKDKAPDVSLLRNNIEKSGFASFRLQPIGEKGVVVRMANINEEDHQRLLVLLKIEGNDVTEKKFDSIGPVIGEELKSKALAAIAVVVILIILFISFVFRNVSRPVASWKYGLVAIVALIHDILIPIGIFAYIGAEVDVLFITALLAILGYSVHDTIIIFDRIRENLKLKISNDFDETVGISLRQTFARSINTSLTVFIVLIFLYFMGGDSTKMFSLAMLAGVIFGTYSSIFLAGPLLTTIQKLQKRR